MRENLVSTIRRIIRRDRAEGASDDPLDDSLLERFVSNGDENAFADVMHRHGAMVFSVCRSILHNSSSAEDAFQATFLVLSRKAASIRKRRSLASWLHGVAYRIAVRARQLEIRRRLHERNQVPAMTSQNPAEEEERRDVQALLAEELQRLPEKYRAVLVLCYLEGKSNDRAAHELGWPRGSIAKRLTRGIELLRARLVQRGVMMSAAAVGTALHESAAAAIVPSRLFDHTLSASLAYAAGHSVGVSAPAAVLASGAIKAMWFARLKHILAVVLLVGISVSGVAAVVTKAPAEPQVAAAEPAQAPPAAKAAPAEEKTAPILEASGPWGTAVDGVACRITVPTRVVVGEPIPAIIEVKNTSDRKRYLFPMLNPEAIEHMTLEITNPKGEKVLQGRQGRGYGLGEKTFEPMAPNEVRRFETVDLRDMFDRLQAWSCYPRPRATPPAIGKYTLKCRFRSPKVPARFVISQTQVAGQQVFEYKDAPKEMVEGQWTAETVSAPVTIEVQPLARDDFVVHEWGVFTVFNDVKYANVNRKEMWGSLPTFFYRQFPTERLRWVPSAWDAPVIYFYAKPRSMHVGVNVSFGEGAPVVWWPAVTNPTSDGGFRTARDPQTPRPFHSLTWEGWLGKRVPARYAHQNESKVGLWPAVKDFELPKDCWLTKARVPDASQITVIGNIDGERTDGKMFPGALNRAETERFIYYDGLVPAQDTLRCEKVTDNSVTLRNRAKFDLSSVFVVDRRNAGAVRMAVVGKKEPLPAGASREIQLEAVEAGEWPAKGLQRFREALQDAGLFEAEARALLAIWSRQLFEADGMTAFHILPASEYDRMLPLEVLPAPAGKPVRVGVALHPHIEIEPELAAKVTALIRELDNDDPGKREAASKTLLEIGPIAISQLKSELSKSPSLEARRRMETVLNRVDAATWLNLKSGPKK